ncbi:ribosome maturation factor RimM [Luteimonas sp. SJ-92]|uniref:Ribosome maturation factor RimM n=1 Tax=Luteimonas salinisoli TaxID=2752307 RepID=A0A853J7S1_9GAMM|nr:ribosome maturation factor RimM [Luteimonas salinisoli]NZA25196.1 ribosome maturation factor RimM [Luteimonas salinisoli]
MNDPGRRILLGRIHGAFGVRGELKLESFTDPPERLLQYRPLILRDARGQECELPGVAGRQTAKGIVARLPGVEDRDAAEAMRGAELLVARSALPPPKPGEYYWVDLEGLRVETPDGIPLGRVAYLFSTGANDVLVARDDARERMIPFVTPDYVRSIDFDAGLVVADWDPDF